MRAVPPILRSTFLSLCALLAAACGADHQGGGVQGTQATPPSEPAPVLPPVGAPMTNLARNAWSWVPFEDAHCDDGSSTGLGVSQGDAAELIVFLDGGGACWDFATCVVAPLSRHGPWGEQDMLARAAGFGGTLFDRSDPQNPFRTWSFVFVPYCTSDVHSGDQATTYTGPNGARHTLQHRGRANVLAFAQRIVATFPQAPKVVIAGASGGGYGAFVNYDSLRRYWPSSKAYLLDDSGPALRGLPLPAERDAWWAAWGTPAVLATFCPECTTDLSAGWTALSRRWPADRIALLSSMRDQTISGFLLAPPAIFEAALRLTRSEVLAPLPNVQSFFVGGDSHTMVGAPDRFTADGIGLRDWLAQMVSDGPAWESRGP
jgi:hypothetical protein